MTSVATATPLPPGDGSFPRTKAWRACRTRRPRPGAPPGFFPPSNAPPSSPGRPNSPPPLIAPPRAQEPGRSGPPSGQRLRRGGPQPRPTIWRTLDAADLKPHRSVYWLNSHDPDFEQRAKEICALYVQSPAPCTSTDSWSSVSDEKTGMQILQRKHPTQPGAAGAPRARARVHPSRHPRPDCLIRGPDPEQVVWDLGLTRTSQDFAAHLLHVAREVRGWQGVTWVLDNLNTHWSVEVCEVLAMLNDLPFCPRSLRTGAQLARLFDRSGTRLPLRVYAQARIVAQPGGIVVQRIVRAAVPEAAPRTSPVRNSSRRGCGRSWRTTTVSRPTHTAGRTRVSHWCGGRRSARRVGSSGRGGRGSGNGRSASTATCTRRAPTSAASLDWRMTYEIDI